MSDLNLDKILNIYNYFDGIMITDEKALSSITLISGLMYIACN